MARGICDHAGIVKLVLESPLSGGWGVYGVHRIPEGICSRTGPADSCSRRTVVKNITASSWR